jgi:hypothetical protein
MRRDWLLACGVASALTALACNDLVEDVSTDVCASGKRWIGGKTGDEEMYPGHDCIACHKANDAPAFFAAGTVYGVYDETGALTTSNDCFGIEGAKVTITGGDGQVFETLTNRAGNFFFEGLEQDLVKPFSAVVEYQLPDGRLSRQPMDSSPSYGGCARCHSPEAVKTSNRCPGGVLDADEVFEVTPLYTGPDTLDAPVTVPTEQECEP